MNPVFNEEIIYYSIEADKKLFVHIFRPENSLFKEAILFLNPLFDEKKRVQKFQTDLARELVKKNYIVFKIDYYGTGDSHGSLNKFSLFDTIKHLQKFYNDYLLKITDTISVIGIRFGSDLSLKIFENYSIKKFYLIQPVVNGDTYLKRLSLMNELYLGHKNINLNKNESGSEIFGYPVSYEDINLIKEFSSEYYTLKNKQIIVIDTLQTGYKSLINQFVSSLKNNNTVIVKQFGYNDFWSSFDYIDTTRLVRSVCELL